MIATGTAIALGIGAAVSAGSSAYAAKKQGDSARRAGDLQTEGLDKQLAFEKDNEARRRFEYDNAERDARAQWDADQQRRAPFREAADAVLRGRAGRLGVTLAPRQAETYPGAQAPPQTLGTLARPQAPPMGEPPPYQPMTAALQPRRLRSLGDFARY